MSETICGYEVHPACGMLPMMSAASLAEMADDIKAHGQQQPIYLYGGRVLDGRNRLKACEIAGVAPEVREWTGEDPVRWVLSLNFHRRHLSDDQKSVVGARAATLLAQRAASADTGGATADAPPAGGESPDGDSPAVDATALEAEGGEGAPAEAGARSAEAPAPPGSEAPVSKAIEKRARETAAALVNVSPRRITRGRKLLERAVPTLVDAVERGALSMSQAQQVAALERDAQEALVARGEEAIVDEIRRMQHARRATRPSFQRALSDLDMACAEWSLSKARDGRYRVAGEADEGPVALEGDSAKDAVMKAWAALHT